MTEKASYGKIVSKYEEFRDREKPIAITKYIKEDQGIGSHLVNAKVQERYRYYSCDYCGEEIRIEKDISKATGGICRIPASLTQRSEIILALHNKCLKPVIDEFKEDTRNVR